MKKATSKPETVLRQERADSANYFQPARKRSQRMAMYQSFFSALQALRANRLRALLTSLGVIIGVGAVIMVISVSEGNSASINSRLSQLSPNELIIRSGTFSTGGVRQAAGATGSLTAQDVQTVTQVSGVAAVSPVVSASGQIIFGSQNWSTQVQGVSPPYQQINNWQISEGSFITDTMEQDNQAVAVIGQTVVDNLFTPQGIDPIGQQIRIGAVPFTVVGTLASKGGSALGNADDIVYVPFSTAQERLVGGTSVNTIDVQVSSTADITTTQTSIQQALEENHGITDSTQDTFSIQNQGQIIQTAEGVSQSLEVLLVSVAAISLLVGGIGIMNIMLVSVTERTREIGIRIAIGARPGDVMSQFLIEAVVLSVLGGIVGILLGVIGGVLAANIGSRPFVLDPISVILAFSFSAVVGVVFGFYPAQRAARMDPIVALRTE